jgi:DnaJ family protein B protein 12
MSEEAKDQARMAMEKAKACRSSDPAKAIRWLEKSIRIHKTRSAEVMLEHLRENAAEQQQQQQNKAGMRNRRTGAASAKPAPSAKREEGKEAPKNYTDVQQKLALRVLQTKNYYEILGITRSATEKDVKLAYRKLSMKLHPDKNKAPEAEEAFKKVVKAHTALSDAKSRRYYDQTGEEEQDTRNRGGGGGGFQGGMDPTADDIFQFFFNGAGGMGGRRGRGTHFRFNTGGFNRQQRRQQQRGGGDTGNAGGWRNIINFLPIIFLFLFMNLGSSPAPSQSFGLHKTAAFSQMRFTELHNTKYYVDNSFSYRYEDPRALAQVEASVDFEYHTVISEKCKQEKATRKGLIADAQKSNAANQAQRLNRAYASTLANCDLLDEWNAVF